MNCQKIIGIENVRNATVDEAMIDGNHDVSTDCAWATTYCARKPHPVGKKVFLLCTALPATGRPFVISILPDFSKPFKVAKDVLNECRAFALALRPTLEKPCCFTADAWFRVSESELISDMEKHIRWILSSPSSKEWNLFAAGMDFFVFH